MYDQQISKDLINTWQIVIFLNFTCILITFSPSAAISHQNIKTSLSAAISRIFTPISSFSINPTS
jgi:hypothetical protein